MTMYLFVAVVVKEVLKIIIAAMSKSKMMTVTAICYRLSRDLFAGAQRSTGRQRVRDGSRHVALFCVRCKV